MPANRFRFAAFGLALLVALAIAVDLLWMPVQVFDALGELLEAQQSPSVWESFIGNFHYGSPFLRPLRTAQIKALFDLAAGEHYWLVYRGFHAALLMTALILFVAVLRIATKVDFAAAAFALAVLVGMHTFWPMVQEAFPINHFLEIVVFCLLTLNLARSRGGTLVDVTAVVTFAAAALTLDSGVLVWIVAVAAWTVGWRGISARGLAAMTVLIAGYFYLRFVVLSSGVPDVSLRSSGFLFAVLEPDQLEQRFGNPPLWLYAYNVLASALSVLASEPRAGVFVATRAWLSGEMAPRLMLAFATSAITTAIVGWAAIRSLRSPRAFDDTARFVVLFAVVLTANAVLSFAYTKNDIMSIAGTFYALAAFAGLRSALYWSEHLPNRIAIVVMVAFSVLATGWSVRAANVHYLLRTQAFRHQNDWVQLPGNWRGTSRWPAGADGQDLIQRLRESAIDLDIPNTLAGEPRWPEYVWEN